MQPVVDPSSPKQEGCALDTKGKLILRKNKFGLWAKDAVDVQGAGE